MPRVPRVLYVFAALALACGSPTGAHKPIAPPPAAFPGAQWIPARPTYLLASRHVRDAQRGLRDAIDSFGMIGNLDPYEVSRSIQQVISVDALSPEALTNIGVDVDGGFALFSEDLNPTLVVHLSGAEQFQAFIDHNRASGLATQSQVVDGTEIFSAKISRSTGISWAVADEWLWVHFTLPFAHDDGTAWFNASHKPATATWRDAWAWADRAAAKAGLTGFADLRQIIASFVTRVPDVVACAQLASPISRLGLSMDGDGRHTSGKITLQLGAAAATVAKSILPAPAGWTELASQAPLAVQWNLDLDAVLAWMSPCLKATNTDPRALTEYGVRSGRAILQTLEPDAPAGTGVVSFDLSGRSVFAKYLDRIPGRSRLEKDRTCGPYAGHSVAVPFVATVDYILTDKVAMAGMGDGLLARAVGTAKPSGGGPIAALDVRPAAMPRETWTWLFGHIPKVGEPGQRLMEHFMRWQDGHVAVTIEGDELVVAASGNRR